MCFSGIFVVDCKKSVIFARKKIFIMRKSLLLLAVLATATIIQAQNQDYFTPYKQTALRLPSVPLLLNDPYFSFWSPYDKLTDGTTKHWDNQQKAMDGLLRVDGQVYRFMGKQRSSRLLSVAPMGNKGRSEERRVGKECS